MMYSLKSMIFGAAVSGVVAHEGCGAGCSHGDHEDNGNIVNPEATASHILVATAEEAENLKAKFDGITEGSEVAALFAELAKEHSTCPSKENGGSLGHFEMGQMVEEFETVIFDRANEIMKVHGPVETQFGQHLILIENRLNGDKSEDGVVPKVKKASASHILVEEEEKCNELKEQILAAEDQAAKFSELAAEHSKCPSGAQAGGNLGNFRQGQMVPEFDEVIFGEDKELTTVYGPVKTQFGFHLIFITERSGVEGASEEVAAEKVDETASDACTEAPAEESDVAQLEDVASDASEESCGAEEIESKSAEL